MVAHDISRHLFQPEKHYTGLRMQQGRVSLDSDFNEARMLDDEAQRRYVVDVIGPHGTSDDGFRISNPVNSPYNFVINGGSYYLGGLRHEIASPTSFQMYRTQSDWLQANRVGHSPSFPSSPTPPRHDLVYLVGWTQGVTSVEDAEFREQAIAVQDTGSRTRNMHRVMVRTGGPTDCTKAFTSVVDDLTVGGHTFDHANNELRSSARLTVVYDPSDADGIDLCTPTALQGFSGAENETIRVQLLGQKRFLWSIDNAAPLYRISVAVTEVQVTVTFTNTTLPRDAAHQPRVGQIIEILPWGANLSNGEHVADHPIAPDVGGSVYARVLTPYDPGTRSFTVILADTTTLEAMIAWLADKPNPYLYGRFWRPGDDTGDDTPEGVHPLLDTTIGIPFQPNVPVLLRGTGFRVTFNQDGILGDHWILATRPATNRDVVPWKLAASAAPHGPRRFYSPLAIIQWTTIGGGHSHVLVSQVHDCRRKFRPLTRIRGCCTVTVGDGNTSFGDFTSINDAIAAIPNDEPGRVCILPGVYPERVILSYRVYPLVLEGCGARTVIQTPADNDTSEGLITLYGCMHITLRSLRLEATGQLGVMVNASDYLSLEDLDITTRRDGRVPIPGPTQRWFTALSSPFPLSTLAIAVSTRFTVTGCKLTMDGDTSPAANTMLMSCSNFQIARCQILTPKQIGSASKAFGGLYLCDVSQFEVIDNHITEGNGHGITFGASLTLMPPTILDWFDPGGRFVLDLSNDCPNVSVALPLTASPAGRGLGLGVGDSSTNVPLLRSINHHGEIRRNQISQMGASGISVLGFWPGTSDPYPMITADDLEIANNILEHNCRTPSQSPLPAGYMHYVAYGGIALAQANNLRIHDNLIQDNGASFVHPVCGIYVLHGENIAIENNLIRNNGPRVAGTALSGIRAGIALQLVGRRITLDEEGQPELGDDTLLPATLVRGNVVSQPAGRALQIYGNGAMVIEGNTLSSEGLVASTPAHVPHCVEIHNVGQSPELRLGGPVPANLAVFAAPPLLLHPGVPSSDPIDGSILFTDNQVRFTPAVGAARDIYCANGFQSHGDVAVLDNQFFVLFPGAGSMFCDTIVTAWSTRVNNNRWEDPATRLSELPVKYDTDRSATTRGVMNYTTLNQATRCIHATLLSGTPAWITEADIGLANNHLATECLADDGLDQLLEAP